MNNFNDYNEYSYPNEKVANSGKLDKGYTVVPWLLMAIPYPVTGVISGIAMASIMIAENNYGNVDTFSTMQLIAETPEVAIIMAIGCGISVVCALIGIILSVAGISKAKRLNYKFPGALKVCIIISSILAFVFLIMCIIFSVSSSAR